MITGTLDKHLMFVIKSLLHSSVPCKTHLHL